MDNSKFKERAIYVTKHGSHAYGLNTESSDLDIKGVFVANMENYLGFLSKPEQIEEHVPNDLVIYEISKFFKLAADCNPNIVEVLWTDEEDIIYCNDLGRSVKDLRQQFLSQRAKFTFSGYAIAQLKRIKNHYRWIKDPPTLPRFSGGYMSQLDDSDREELEKYAEWKKNRNPARAALEEKFGYDTKHAMHLVRLMRMGHEILTTGKVNVKRDDREELLAIRNHGIWSYDQLVEYAESMDKKLTEVYNAKTSPLPYTPDLQHLNKCCAEIVSSFDYNVTKKWDRIIPKE